MTDPTDETPPNPAAPDGPPAAPDPAGATAPSPPAGAETAAPGLRVDPARPSDPGWREPAWYPPRDARDGRNRRSGTVATVVGLVLIAIGAWSFLQTTIGLDLPQLRWDSLWPVILIAIGAVILIRSIQRRP